jgi:hypothetical protein
MADTKTAPVTCVALLPIKAMVASLFAAGVGLIVWWAIDQRQ